MDEDAAHRAFKEAAYRVIRESRKALETETDAAERRMIESRIAYHLTIIDEDSGGAIIQG